MRRRMKSKELKTYELYDGFSLKSINYLPTRKIFKIAAFSAKQAIYLASNNKWQQNEKEIGIVTYKINDINQKNV